MTFSFTFIFKGVSRIAQDNIYSEKLGEDTRQGEELFTW